MRASQGCGVLTFELARWEYQEPTRHAHKPKQDRPVIVRLTLPPEVTLTGAVLWEVPVQALPPLPVTKSFRGIKFRLKPEFHLTVLGKEEGKIFTKPGGAARLEEWRDAWRQFDNRIEVLAEVWLLRKSDADFGVDHTLAVACLAPAVALGRQLLSTWTATAFPERPPHITLYYGKDLHGISVASQQALLERRVESGSWASFGLVPGSGSLW